METKKRRGLIGLSNYKSQREKDELIRLCNQFKTNRSRLFQEFVTQKIEEWDREGELPRVIEKIKQGNA